MSEVLTQSQIDALLNSVNSGGDEKNQVLEEASKKERKYDFRAPKRFTKDRLKLLDSVYSNYARIVSSHLSSILRLACDVELIDVEEQKYSEFNNALNENDVLSIIDVDMDAISYRSDPVMMQLSNSIAYVMMDRMMGGSGEQVEDIMAEFTDIELMIYRNLTSHIVPLMDDAWRGYFDIKFDFASLEVNPRLVQTLSMDDIVVIVVLNISIHNTNGKINICLPGNTLEIICKSFEESKKSSNKRKEQQVENARDDILANISGSTLEIKAKLANAEALLADIIHLQEGDVVNLNKPKQSDVILCVEDEPWYTGTLGVKKQNIAIKINGFATNIMRTSEE